MDKAAQSSAQKAREEAFVEPRDPRGLLAGAGVLGAVLTITGVVMAIVHGYRGKQVVPCPQGTTFPADSTDNNCYSYPHAFAGWMGPSPSSCSDSSWGWPSSSGWS